MNKVLESRKNGWKQLSEERQSLVETLKSYFTSLFYSQLDLESEISQIQKETKFYFRN